MTEPLPRRKWSGAILIVWSLCTTPILVSQVNPSPEASSDRALLAGAGLEAKPEPLLRFLLPPDNLVALHREIKRCVTELASNEYEVRIAATRRLGKIGTPALDALRGALALDDLEVYERASKLITEIESADRQRIRRVAARSLAQQADAQHLSGIVRLLEVEKELEIRQMVIETLGPRLGPWAVPGLEKAFDRPDDRLRVGLLRLVELGRLEFGEEIALRLARAEGASSALRLAAASVLVSRTRREGIGILIDLLDDPDLEIRYQVEYRLRETAGSPRPLNAYADPKDRKKWQVGWRSWWKESRQSFVFERTASVSRMRGTTFLVDHSNNRLLEVDRSGKILWEHAMPRGPSHIQFLENGNLLVAGGYNGDVVEMDRQGKVLWRVTRTGLIPDAEKLANGQVLVVLNQAGQIVVVDRSGKEVRSIRGLSQPADVDVLPGGNWLVTETGAGRVTERDSRGRIVWEKKGLLTPWEADRLPNGNTLIAESGNRRVVEVDRSGKVVWQRKGLAGPHEVDRLANGNTLISDSEANRVLEVSPDGRVVWEFKDLNHPDDADRR